MSILTDSEIIEEVKRSGMIENFVDHQVREKDGKKIVSYGCGSSGVDIRIGTEWKKPCEYALLDPLEPRETQWNAFSCSDPIRLEPDEIILGKSVEKFNMPDDVMAIAVGKSTYARIGVFCNITPLEVSWRGYLVVEIANLSQCTVIVYPNQGISQLIFFRLDKKPLVTYAQGNRKYQNQEGIWLARG